jgi:HlyD family secretion protein
MRPARILLLVILLAAAGAAGWWYTHRPAEDGELVLYGNVDLRQASLPFSGSERIADILVEEGDIVAAGDVLARLDTGRLTPQVAQAEAAVATQAAALDELRNGSRPEEVAQAEANLAAAEAEAVNARAQYERRQRLGASSTISVQEVDTARAAAEVADAQVEVSRRALDLVVAGPRAETVAGAEAQLRNFEAQLDLARRLLSDAELRAPFGGVVTSRLMEPGEMASPTRPVVTLATTGVKWVRAYVSEANLGQVAPGMRATIATDSFPDRPLDGWIGFISPVAEFTPRTVQTEDLRTSLVYEVRVFVEDPDDVLRIGMPATVRLLPGAEPHVAEAE